MTDNSISSDVLGEMLFCARRIDQSVKSNELTTLVCGVECHHDQSGRADFGILIDAEQLSTAKWEGMPQWWNALIARSPTNNPKLARHDPRMLPVHNFLEFDATGDGLILGGVFQTVNPPEHPDSNDFDALRDHLARMQFSRPIIDASTRLNLCFEQLGMPEQIGMMSGRGDVMKVVTNPYRSTRDRIAAVLDAIRGDVSDGWSSLSTREWRDFLLAPDKPHFARLSVDIDLARDRFLPRLGIEIADIANERGELDAGVCDFLLHCVRVDNTSVLDMQRLRSQFPVGVERAPGQDLPAFARQLVKPHRRSAHLSHIKVVVRPMRGAVLKSYVEVRQELCNPQ